MNYPPGVTGMEPHISGEWPVDPHAPFDVLGESVGVPDPEWIVVFGNSEDAVGNLTFKSEAEARKFADDLNSVWPQRECKLEPNGTSGIRQCRVCGDYEIPGEELGA